MSKIEFKFDPNQQFQLDAIESVVDIFDGQELRQGEFTAFKHSDNLFGQMNELGYGNRLDLTEEDILKNVVAIQDRNRLPRSKDIIDAQYDVPNFAIEMETGTGKTYVYTRSIMELKKRYGMTKFIIVVPSVAIREGVQKSLDNTKKHFKELYPEQSLNYFIYDSSQLNRVRGFATSDAIEVMIINIDAFRKGFKDIGKDMDLEKTANIIHKPSDQLSGRAPIEFIQQTNPIVIIDEPQSVDNTDKAKEAIQSLNPLCIFRYSATHRKTYNLMYRLGPVEAHDKKLVKTIEVLSVQDEDTNDAYLKLIKTYEKSKKAKVAINVIDDEGKVYKEEKRIKTGDDLYYVSGENGVYDRHVISSINFDPDNQYIELEDGSIITPGEGESDDELKRAQIHNTIKAHLEKELVLLEKGIKVISLFFIDKVSHYREHSEEDGELVTSKGKYAEMFEEEYKKIISHNKYKTLFSSKETNDYVLNSDAQEVHDGYFAKDRKGKVKDTGGNTKADASAYDLIMKDKERLLDLGEPLRFIFSHSTLKEGWDNPNVFQVCTLVDTKSTMTKRQKVGRGLRLPVDQDGDRVKESRHNILTVVANESYEEFADTLQREIEEETNTKFGVIDERLLETIISDGDEIGYENAEKIVNTMREDDLLDSDGKATKELKRQLVTGEFTLPEEFKDIEDDVEERIKSMTRRLPIFDADDKESIEINKEMYLSEDFEQLWNRIKYKTIYRLNFSSDVLKQESIKALKNMRPIKTNTIIAKYVQLRVDKEGVKAEDPNRVHTYEREFYKDRALPDFLSHIEQYTGLKRQTIASVLIESGRLEDVFKNPQMFMEEVVDKISGVKRDMILDGIEYEKIGDETYWSQDLFEDEDLIGYLKENAIPVNKSIYSHVIYDSSTVEKPFAEALDADKDVKLFIKLPSWFKIDTPLGTYNPDWAIVLDKNNVERLYFVVETKGSIAREDLRGNESGKITCGRKHFRAIGDEVQFDHASGYELWKSGI